MSRMCFGLFGFVLYFSAQFSCIIHTLVVLKYVLSDFAHEELIN